MSREPRRARSRQQRWPATLPPSRPFVPHMRRFVPNTEFARSWFKDFAELLNPRHPSSVKLADLEDSEIDLSSQRRSEIEKQASASKANYFIKECISGQRFFVKQSLNLDRLKRDQKFREFRIPFVLTASHWFECQDSKSETQNSGFIVFPFLHCWTLREICHDAAYMSQITEQEWLLGLVGIIEVFAITDPNDADAPLHFFHCDLHGDQIVFDHKQRRWFLIDLGNAKLCFEEHIGTTPPRWVELDVIAGSQYVATPDQEFARARMLFKPGLKKQWHRIEDACKANTRQEALVALQTLYVDLHGPLPALRPEEEEEPAFSVVSGVSQVTAAPGLSYVEAAQLERQRAEERARRNNRGFMQQVEMMMQHVDSPRRAAAARPQTPKAPSPRRKRNPTPKKKSEGAVEHKPAVGPVPQQRPVTILPADEDEIVDVLAASSDTPLPPPPPATTPRAPTPPPIPAPVAQPPPMASLSYNDSDSASDKSATRPNSNVRNDSKAEVVSSPAEPAVSPVAPGVNAEEPELLEAPHSPPSIAPPAAPSPPPDTAAPVSRTSPTPLQRQGSSPPKHPPRARSPEIAPLASPAAVADACSDSNPQAPSSRRTREVSPARTASQESTAPPPPPSPSVSVVTTSVRSPRRSQTQRLEEEAAAWRRRQERKAAETSSAADSSACAPHSTSLTKSENVSPSKQKRREVPEADRVAQEALAWQRRLERRMAEQHS